MSFSDYLKNRQKGFETVTNALEKEAAGSGAVDERFWAPKMGPDETGYAVIRFLPGLNVSKSPYVKVYSHNFEGPTKKWYIENSLTTFGEKDPVGEFNSDLWNRGEEGQKQARKQKRRINYYANVYVIEDSMNPDDVGKVKLFRFGPRIFDKITSAMKPEFGDETPINPFDIIEGANFKLKIKIKDEYWNYENSGFADPTPLSTDMGKLEEIFNSQYDIQDFLDRKHFKTYEELEARLKEVMAGGRQVTNDTVVSKTNDDVEEFTKKIEESVSKVTIKQDDDDDLESFFKSLSKD